MKSFLNTSMKSKKICFRYVCFCFDWHCITSLVNMKISVSTNIHSIQTDTWKINGQWLLAAPTIVYVITTRAALLLFFNTLNFNHTTSPFIQFFHKYKIYLFPHKKRAKLHQSQAENNSFFNE